MFLLRWDDRNGRYKQRLSAVAQSRWTIRFQWSRVHGWRRREVSGSSWWVSGSCLTFALTTQSVDALVPCLGRATAWKPMGCGQLVPGLTRAAFRGTLPRNTRLDRTSGPPLAGSKAHLLGPLRRGENKRAEQRLQHDVSWIWLLEIPGFDTRRHRDMCLFVRRMFGEDTKSM